MNSEKSQQQNGEFKKVLGLGSLIIFGLAYMAPTVVFNYYGPLSVASKGMYPTCFVITAIAMFFTAFSYANMSRELRVCTAVTQSACGIPRRLGNAA